MSTILLVLIYLVVTVARRRHTHGTTPSWPPTADDVLSALGGPVLGSPLDKVLIIAVLTSASASTQTTILPTAQNDAIDGALRGDPQGVRADPPALPDPRTSSTLDDGRGVPGRGRCSSSTSATNILN